MINVISFVRRKPGMALDAFSEYWRTIHAGVVRRVPEIRRYVQSQTIASGYTRGEPLFDGVAEIWYDDTAAIHRAAHSPEAAAAFADDENFLDMRRFASIVTDEVVQKNGAATPAMKKIIEVVARKPGMDPAAFHRYWSETHGPLAAKIPQLRRYVQCHVRPSAYRDGRAPIYDGVAETWFDDTGAMRASARTAEYAAKRADEPNFIDGSRLAFIITGERVMIG